MVEPLANRAFVVAAVAVVATFLLSSKPTIHPMVKRISAEDGAATIKFLIVSVVVLPLLPDRTVDPLDIVNPFQVGVLMVLISALSFLGYGGIRLLGTQRGMGLTGVVGGVVSSTAVTLSMSGRARERPEITEGAALAVVLASTIMFVRVYLIVVLVNASLAKDLLLPMAASTVAGVVASIRFWLRSQRNGEKGGAIAFHNPFELLTALKFALLFAVVLLVSKASAIYLGTAGTYAAGVLAGSTDVDAITLSMSKLAGGSVSVHVAATTIFLGTASNTVIKGTIAGVLGGWRFGRPVLAALLSMLAFGAVGIGLAWMR